ncbi:PREDICTED: RAD51-associated protein 1-like [Acropora digitifera]|uniref:RAD51-associated protein 1-like n=1 Tax=Acropora digitifera TaxID=70779 RepID=UPI00077AC996|nr:PREDICTED: RAD51-associated protein 1-like [Acropora digitifera]
MSLGRRSDRVRKKVDYAKFCEDEDRSENNSDDDFQDGAIPPPLKKIKSTVPVKSKAKQKHEEAKSISKQSGAVKRKERLSRDEKLYQKELEAALKASIIESQQSSADNDSSSTANNDEEDISDEEDRVESKRKKARLLPSSDVEDNNNKENTDGDTQINWTRRSASDGEAGSIDDIKYKQVTKTSNLKKRNTLEEVEDEEERDEPELDQEASANEPAVLQPKAVEAMSDSLPKTIPGMGLGGVNIKSSGPSIRLGLSRNVRVKPLHSHVSVQH